MFIHLLLIASYISIHALRGEGDPRVYRRAAPPNLFLSTPSVGRATKILPRVWRKDGISIHALRGEGDGRK